MTSASPAGPAAAAALPLMDKILCRFKMIRRGSSVTDNVAGPSLLSEACSPRLSVSHAAQVDPSILTSESLQPFATAGTTNSYTAPQGQETSTENASPDGATSRAGDLEADTERFSLEDLGPFCDQLDRLLQYIRSMKEINHLIYSYPSIQQRRLEASAIELHLLHVEARAALQRIQQVKDQRKAVRKECRSALKALTNIREEEVKEMENLISAYDKTLLARWEKIRNSMQQDIIESFLLDIKGKQEALSHLHTLVTHKLLSLKPPANTDEGKPMNLAVRRLTSGGCARNGGGRWRSKHHERAQRVAPASTGQDASSVPLIPQQTTPYSLSLGPLAPGTTSSTSVLGSTSGGFITTVPNSPTLHASQERRSMLQALFSDLHHTGTHDNLPINAVMPNLVGSSHGTATTIENTGSYGATNRGNEQNQRDIELFSVHHSHGTFNTFL